MFNKFGATFGIVFFLVLLAKGTLAGVLFLVFLFIAVSVLFKRISKLTAGQQEYKRTPKEGTTPTNDSMTTEEIATPQKKKKRKPRQPPKELLRKLNQRK